MIDTTGLPFFLLAATLVIVIPGPSVFYIVARSVDQGRRAGVVSVMGIAAGALFHVAAAAVGLSALLASSAVAFNTIKYLGAAYLVYLGLRRILAREETTPASAPPRKSHHLFYEGLMVNLLNPKTALFFLAFLPQFVNPSLGPVRVQVMILGCLFIAIGVTSDAIYALLAGGAGVWFRRHTRAPVLQRYLSGGVFIALGLATALSGTGRNK